MALASNIVVLTGGVGGAKLARGLLDVAPAERLTFIVNTGDDFWHLGLRICPDLDTTLYTLADLVEPQQGWGLRDDSTVVLDALQEHYGHEPWFKLGDKDLATHLLRGEMLRRGLSLTDITERLSGMLGIGARLLPMCDAEMPTIVETRECGELGFQEYFVKHRWQPAVKAIRYCGGAESQSLGCRQVRIDSSCYRLDRPVESLAVRGADLGRARNARPIARWMCLKWRSRPSSAVMPSRVPPPKSCVSWDCR